MAKITVLGNALVATSAKSLSALETLFKYRPSALTLKEKDEETGRMQEVFTVSVTDHGNGSLGEFGACFSGATRDEAKLATITMALPSNVPADGVKEWIADHYGAALMMLNKVEAQVDAALAAVAEDKAAVMANISVQ